MSSPDDRVGPIDPDALARRALAGPRPVAIVGPTASGKSALALEVARRARAARSGVTAGGGTDDDGAPGSVELVSIDSMAVYRGMDIGTAKPDRPTREEVPYHLLDLADPSEEFTVQQFQAAAAAALDGIAARGRSAVLVGGTGLYLRSVIDELHFPGRFPEVAAALRAELAASPDAPAATRALHARLAALDPVAAGRMEPTNERRVVRALEVTIGSGRPFSSFGPGLGAYPPSRFTLVGLRGDPEGEPRRIAERFDRMMDAGLLDEVRRLAARPGGLSTTARQALGYRELLGHLEDGVPLAEAVDEAVRRTRAFARRQWAWFRRDPRIVWLDPRDDPAGSVLEALRAGTGPDGGPAPVGGPS